MFNTVILTGRLTADPSLKSTQSGVSVCGFCIAVQRKYHSGEETQSDFINIVSWRQTAEFVTKYFRKGNMIGVEGCIQTRKYTDKDGNNRVAFEVLANNVQFVEGKKAESGDIQKSEPDPLEEFKKRADAGFTTASSEDDLPF